MGRESIIRQFVDNSKIWWGLLRKSANYAVCDVAPGAHFRGSIIRNNGSENRLIVEEGAKVSCCTFCFNGNQNTVIIHKYADVNNCVFFLDDNENHIEIGENSTFTGKSEFIANETTSIEIGNDCMFAYGIVLRTGDHHSIFDSQGKRINPAKSIRIGNHVWIGQNAYILKGVDLKDGCIAGACSVVTKSPTEPQSILVWKSGKSDQNRNFLGSRASMIV